VQLRSLNAPTLGGVPDADHRFHRFNLSGLAIAMATLRVLAKGDLDAAAALVSAVG
jgi:hypothetical protein